MRPQVIAPSDIPSFLWNPPQSAVSAALSHAVLSELRANVMGGGRAGAEEFGGILLGSVESYGDGFRTRVEAIEPFPIEHRYGPTFRLSPRDQKRLRERVERLAKGRRRPVGLYRSHQRRGLYLDERDADIFRSEFSHPSSIFLLVRPSETEGARGGVFIWEGGDMRRHASYLEFPIDGAPIVPAAPAIPAVHAVVAVQAVPAVHAVAAVQAVPAVAAPRPILVSFSRLKIAAMLLAGLVLPLAGFYMGRTVALRDRDEEYVASVQAAPAARAVPEARAVPAAPAPPTEPAPQAVAAPTPLPAAPYEAPSPFPVEPAPTAAVPKPRPTPRPARNYRERTARLVLPKLPERKAAAETPALPDPPSAGPAFTGQSLPKIAAVEPSAPVPDKVVAYIKPGPSSFGHAIRKVLGGKRHEGFVEASPIEHPLPAVTAAGEKPLEMEAKIDRDGNVVNVKAMQGKHRFAAACADVLRRWRFDPARQNGDPVESDVLVRFEFSNAAR